MTDRELLEAAAKAAGIDIEWQSGAWAHNNETGCEWNPLTNSGDALELAVKLRLDIGFEKLHMVSVWCRSVDDWVTEHCDDGMGSDIAEKTRRAIVRAAASIGKEMK